MISGRRPKRPDGQYYRQSRKLRPSGARKGPAGGQILLWSAVLVAGIAIIWWLT
jgi:hypothetical protein